MIEITESNELLTKYQYKIESNTNLLTGNKFVYGFDEYFLNINYTNYLIDTSKTVCIKFKWSVYGSLFWFFSNKNIPSYQINLLNDMFKYIYDKIGFNFVKDDNLISKFETLKNNIYKNNWLSQKILFQFYKFFIIVENDERYRFVFEKNIYTLIKKYNLFGIYDFEIMTFASVNSEYFNFISKNMFSPVQINKLKKIKIKYESLSRANNSKNIPISSIDCNIKFFNNLSINNNIWVDYFNLDGKNVVVKKEIYNDENNIFNEYDFFKKYSMIIKNDHLGEFILLPIEQIKNCYDEKKKIKWHIYVFDKLNWNYNNEFIGKINFIDKLPTLFTN